MRTERIWRVRVTNYPDNWDAPTEPDPELQPGWIPARPRRRRYFSRSAAEYMAGRYRDLGCTVVIEPSTPITWENRNE